MIAPRIVAIGDSHIYGRLDAVNGGWIGQLRRRLEGTYPQSAMFNLGIGGETTKDVLNRIKSELEPRKPNAIIIGVGTNDARRRGGSKGKHEVDPKRFEKYLHKLVVISRALTPCVLIPSVLGVDEARTQKIDGFYYDNKDFKHYHDIQARLSQSMHVTFLDFFTALPMSDPKISPDGIHLSTAGHESLFSKKRPEIEQFLESIK